MGKRNHQTARSRKKAKQRHARQNRSEEEENRSKNDTGEQYRENRVSQAASLTASHESGNQRTDERKPKQQN